MTSRIQIAKPDIVKKFETLPRVLRGKDVAQVFEDQREFWRLTKSMTVRSFIDFMTEKTLLSEVRFAFPQRDVIGYTWGQVPTLEVLLGLIDDSFYSHYTAVRIHGLTEQVPKTIYVNHERSRTSALGRDEPQSAYEQDAIDRAYRRPPRVSHNQTTFNGTRIVLLQSAYQHGIGLTSGAVNYGGDRPLKLRYTTLERTLIDAAVRPFYAGGVFEVAKAFENARDEVSVNAMAAMLKNMRFGYPYHQAIGYYLERAQYKPSVVELFRKMPMERDFFLTHEMKKTSYVKRWRLHVPEGF